MSSRTLSARPRVPARSNSSVPRKWAWHYRTLWALRDHLAGTEDDRLREPGEALERPSLHLEDFVDEVYDRTMVAALPSDPAAALREIHRALRRIERGSYGICEATGQPIPRSQLRAKPWSRRAETKHSAAR